jgi:membrane protease YdiL (CAAX protease family)
LLAIFEPANLFNLGRMAYLATKRVSYWGQFGILAAFTGAGLLIGGIVSLIPLLGKMDLDLLSSKKVMESLFVPENASALRWVQFLTTFFLFFLPPIFYARLCHQKAFTHLGFKHKVTGPQFLIAMVIMVAALPLVGALAELTKMLPFSKITLQKWEAVEEAYNKQVAIIGRMNNFGDYVLSLFMLAICPAIFEETMFRGGMQNLLSRWWKMPILAIVVTAIIFSIVHGSYFGFLSRAVLGFILGWMYYRTGNIWLNIIAHAANNAVAVTAIYIMRLKNPKMDIAQADVNLSIWWGLLSLAVIYGLFILFERVSQYQINKPGEEVILRDDNYNQPSWVTDREP